jgi:dipeptide/tripeptide permease
LLLLGFLSLPFFGAVVSVIIFENILYGIGVGYLIGFVIYVIVKKFTLDNRFDVDDHMDAFRDVFVRFYAVTLLSLIIQIPVVVILQTQDTFMLVIKIVDILLFNFIIIYLFGLNKKEKNQIGLFLYPLNEWIKKNYRNNIAKYELIEKKEKNKKKVSA